MRVSLAGSLGGEQERGILSWRFSMFIFSTICVFMACQDHFTQPLAYCAQILIGACHGNQTVKFHTVKH